MGNCWAGDVRGGGSGGRAAPNDAVDLFLKSRAFNSLFSQIELSLSTSNLRDRDMLSKSDPMAVVYAKRRDGTLEEIGRTEVVLNSLNPAWIAKFVINYQFEVVQPMVFQVYDIDSQFHNMPVEVVMR